MEQALGALNPAIYIAIILVVLGALVYFVIDYVWRARRRDTLPNTPLAVMPKPIMTDAERAFFHTLQNAFANRYEIFPQVALECLVSQTGKLPANVWGMLRNSRVDFVLAHPRFLGPIAVLELDDSSHTQATTRARDEIKERILQGAKIPLLRFRVGDKWDATAIRLQVEQIVNVSN